MTEETEINRQSDWLIGEGEMTELIRTMDWSDTPLGSRQSWPQSLRVVVNMILPCSFPMCILWGKELVLIYNDAFQAATDPKRPRAIARSIREVWPEKWALNKSIFENIMSRGQTVHSEDQFFRTSRNTHSQSTYFTLSYSPIRTEDRQIGGMLLVLQETTRYRAKEHKKTKEALRQSEAIYRAIGESLKYGIWVCDDKGHNTYASESFLNLLGITQEQCSKFAWGDVLHPDDAVDTLAAWEECVSRGNYWERELRLKDIKGKWHPILSRGVPIRNADGKTIKWAGINLDISRMKQTEGQLRDAIMARDEFISVASHELKTPMTALHLQLQMLERIAKSKPVNIKHLTTMSVGAFQSSQQLVRLIEELLDITKIRAGKLNMDQQEMDLREVVIESVSTVLEEARQSGSTISVKAEEPVLGKWDPARMRQVLSNLLSNAIKYGAGKPIQVELEIDHKTSHTRLLVRDHGIGIPPEMHAKIFERFERAVSGRKISGLGLGLYIVHKIVEAHGGTISVESKPEEGSLFTVDLPLISQDHPV